MTFLPNYRWADLRWMAVLTVVYAVLVILGLHYLASVESVSIMWFPSGLGLAALLLGGRKYWPVVFLGALAGYFVEYDKPLPLMVSIALFSNTLEAVLGTSILSCVYWYGSRFNPALQRPIDFVLLSCIGGGSAGVAAFTGTVSLWLSNLLSSAHFLYALTHWWIGNFLGMILLTPLILTFCESPLAWLKRERFVEAIACFGLAFVFGLTGLMGWLPSWLDPIPHDYGMFLFVVWSSVRFGRQGALLIVGMTAVQALPEVITHMGHFSTEIAETSLIDYWFYILAISSVGIVLALVIRERDRAEAELRESEANLHAILDNAPIGIWLVGLDGQYRFLNKTFRDSTGIGNEPFLTTSRLPEFLGTAAAATCVRTDIEAMGKAAPMVTHETLKLVDGNSHLIEVTKARLLGPDGEVTGVIGISVDITERKRVEESAEVSRIELKRQSDLLQSMLESIDQGFAVWNADNRLVVWNRKCVEFWYHPKHVRAGMEQQDLLLHIARNHGLGPGDPKTLAFAKGQSILGGEAEDEFTMTNGMVVHVTRYPMSEGRYASVYTDITERKLADEALSRSEERWKFALEGSGDAAWDRNIQTYDGVYSRRWREMLGYGEDELMPECDEWMGPVHPEDLPHFEEALQAYLEGRTSTLVHEQRVLSKDGSWKWILTRGMLVSRDADGKPLRLIGTHSDITELRLVQKLQIHAVLDSSAEAKLLVEYDGAISYANSAAKEVFGYTMEELLEIEIDMLVPLAQREGHARYRADFLRNPDRRPIGFNQNISATRKDGTVFPVEIGVSPIRMDNRMIVMVSVVDITERKLAEDMLKEQEGKLRAIYEGSNDAIMLLTEKGFFDCNLRTLEMFGLESKEVFTSSHPAHVSPPFQSDGRDSMTASVEHITLALRQGSDRFEWVHRRSSGDDFPADVMLSAFDYGGERVLQATVRDITERKHAEELLERESYRNEMLLRMASDGIHILDLDGSVTEVNDVFCQMLGYSRDEMLSMNVTEWDVQWRATELKARVRDVVKYGAVFETLHRRKDHSVINVEINAIQVVIGGQQLLYCSARDITERKQVEVAILKAKESAEAALKRAKMAEHKILNISEETRERIGQELHDNLGQHLTGVAFLSEVLSTKLKKQGWADMQLVSKITSLINEAVLNTRQLAQGLYPVELKAAGLQAMLSQLANHVRSIYKIDCEVEFDEMFWAEGPDVAINLFRIAQEASNNAIKHGGATQIIIKTSAAPDFCTLEISDNGRGLNWRGEHSGLGMHTMQYRASLVGATLRFDVSSNGGTSVVVSFPVQQEGRDHVV